jgi:hypothetical protein
MRYLSFVFGALAMLAGSNVLAQQSASSPVLACVAPDKLGCGCHIRLAGQSCANQQFQRQPHMFTALDVGAPLLLVMAGQERTLPHVSHIGSSVKGDPPGRSSDLYESKDLRVNLRYSMAPSTCPKNKPEGCEFTDVNVEVSLTQRGQKTWVQLGSGICGC